MGSQQEQANFNTFEDQFGRPKTQDEHAKRDKDRTLEHHNQHPFIEQLSHYSYSKIIKPKT